MEFSEHDACHAWVHPYLQSTVDVNLVRQNIARDLQWKHPLSRKEIGRPAERVVALDPNMTELSSAAKTALIVPRDLQRPWMHVLLYGSARENVFWSLHFFEELGGSSGIAFPSMQEHLRSFL